MDFSFLRNWVGTSAGSTNLSVEQSNSALDEFINPRDPNEIHFLPDQTGKSVVEIAGFSKEKLLKMSNFCKISYGDGDDKLSKTICKTLIRETCEFINGEEWVMLNGERMYKTRAELTSKGYEIIPFGNSFEGDAGHVFIKDNEITIAYHGTRLKYGLLGLNDVITDLNGSFVTSELLPEGGRIHRGFYNSFMDSWPNLYGILKSHAKKQGSEIKDFKINLTGHSMGGAIAKIAALSLNKTEEAKDIHVATFGDPRVFDLTASEFYNKDLQKKTIRVTQHRQDPIPAVSPGSFGYAHVGAQLRISAPKGYSVHKIDGYHEAIKTMDERNFQSNNDVSLFYYPSKMLGRINCAILGNVQYYAANLLGYAFSQSNFFEEVKSKYQNPYQAKQVEGGHENTSQIEQVKVESYQNVLSAVMGALGG
ncbi:lipase family protein [Wolbachia endosymbiont of Atemnus politus]|uniref:lipase family protein n=1 Tax=Wolbachia endosymbiont of Atemnus politus TaxID=2682840 RepID=UPI0015732A65|nr:lipase family protein [Wolbachia endosymbiont of Atemnus politus]NSX83038.1 lipase family protein [Wolbachia endosymbiont of Atemnus politus]